MHQLEAHRYFVRKISAQFAWRSRESYLPFGQVEALCDSGACRLNVGPSRREPSTRSWQDGASRHVPIARPGLTVLGGLEGESYNCTHSASSFSCRREGFEIRVSCFRWEPSVSRSVDRNWIIRTVAMGHLLWRYATIWIGPANPVPKRSAGRNAAWP